VVLPWSNVLNQVDFSVRLMHAQPWIAHPGPRLDKRFGAGYHRFDKQSRLAHHLRKFRSLAPPRPTRPYPDTPTRPYALQPPREMAAYQRQPCNRCCFASMVGLVISRKLWLPILTFAAIVLVISGCSFAEDNVGSINESAAPQSTPQVPESMKTGSVTGETQYPPQGL
jgi:hypothetical protein